MKKWVLLLITTTLVVALTFILYKSQAPQGKIIFSKPAYEDDSFVVYNKKSQYLIVKKGPNNELLAIPNAGDSQIKKIIRLSNKSPWELPLYGESISEGVKIVDNRKTHIAGVTAELKLLASYPTPGTDNDKIIVDKNTNTLYLFKSEELYKSYRVATGRDTSFTPEGTFIIKNKLNDDDLTETLGIRWLGLGVPCESDNRAEIDDRSPEGLKYGIHGTDEPESIGNHASGGCIRMSNEDVKELYSLVKVGTEVEIIGGKEK